MRRGSSDPLAGRLRPALLYPPSASSRRYGLIEEGKRRTQVVIDNDPVLWFMLHLRDQSEPRGLPALTAHIPSLASEANAQGMEGC